jgi:DNA-binding CsgD family transcriptional regulator
MLDSLRAYGREQLASSGETAETTSARNSHALLLAEDAAALMRTPGGEASATSWFDAESALLHRALLSRLDHDRDQGHALRLGVALAPWWRLRGLRSMGYPMLLRAVDQSCSDPASGRRAAQRWLGRLALENSAWQRASVHFASLHDAAERDAHETDLVDALVGRSAALRNLGRLQTAAADAERGRALAQPPGYTEGEALALVQLVLIATTAGDADTAGRWHAQLREIDPSRLPDEVVRQIKLVDSLVSIDVGDLDTARRMCAQGLDAARIVADITCQADFLYLNVEIALLSEDTEGAASHIRESLRLTAHSGHRLRLLDYLNQCARLCAATNRPEAAITIWAALSTQTATLATADKPRDRERRSAALARAREQLGPTTLRESERRGSVMTLQATVELAGLLVTSTPPRAQATPDDPGLTPREKELLILLAQGHTDAEIAESMFISIRTVRSHLDRIRAKSGCRRRAELTRLALQNALI